MTALAVRQQIGLVVCRNLDGWHETPLFVEYLMWVKRTGEVKIIDSPDHKTCLKVLTFYQETRDTEVVYRTCHFCQRRLRG